MESFDTLSNLLEWYAAVFCGCCFAWYAASLLDARTRLAGIILAAAYSACRLLLPILLPAAEPDSAHSVLRLLLLLAASLALCYLCCRQRGLLMIYVCISWAAVFELAFFLAYTVILAADPIYTALTDQIVEHPEVNPQHYLDRILRTAYVFQFFMSVILTGICIYSCRTIIRSFPRERLELTLPEFRLLVLPAVTGLLMCILLRILMIVITDGIPVLLFDRYAPLRFVVPGIAFAAGAAIIYVVQTFGRMVQLEAEQRSHILVEEQLSSLRALVVETERTNAHVSRMRHDLRNTLTVIQALSENVPGAQDLQAYLADLNGEMRSLERPFHTGDPVADVLLAVKYEELHRALPEAQMETCGFILPEVSTISSYDLGVILGNALDNALRALKEQKTGQRFVRLRSFRHEDLLCMVIENSTDAVLPAGSLLPASTKSETGHGIGLSSIEAMVSKYDGTLDWKLQDGVFRLSVMIKDLRPE